MHLQAINTQPVWFQSLWNIRKRKIEGFLPWKAVKREPKTEWTGAKCVHVSIVYFLLYVGKSKRYLILSARNLTKQLAISFAINVRPFNIVVWNRVAIKIRSFTSSTIRSACWPSCFLINDPLNVAWTNHWFLWFQVFTQNSLVCRSFINEL